MIKLLGINIKSFMRNNKFFFLLFILTMTVVSFAGIFILNVMGQDILTNSDISSVYYVEFESEQSLESIRKNMYKSLLIPSDSSYFNETASSYISFKNSRASGSNRYSVSVRSEKLTGSEPVGIYTEILDSVYSKQLQPSMIYGSEISSADSGMNNAVVSYLLDSYVTDGKIVADDTVYTVIGCYRDAYLFPTCNIKISPETFIKNEQGVIKAYFSFSIAPFKKSIEKFESLMSDSIIDSNSLTLYTFGFNTAGAILLNIIEYLVFYICILVVDIIMFHCWVSNALRNYSIYMICGIDRFAMKISAVFEMLVYTLFSGSIGTFLYYMLLASKYKSDVLYPPVILVILNLIIIYLFSCVISFHHLKKMEKQSFIYNI